MINLCLKHFNLHCTGACFVEISWFYLCMCVRWVPPQHGSEDMEIEQLVLPEQCHQGVIQLAHTIPLAGHLGEDKTAQ